MVIKIIIQTFSLLLVGISTIQAQWICQKGQIFSLYYSPEDGDYVEDFQKFIDKGVQVVGDYFETEFTDHFDIYIHPNRRSLDSTWQHDWGMPGFQSECWMVASGVATQLDIISPVRWDSLSCEHHYAELEKTQNLISHELVHVFHGQRNISPDFSNVSGIDWFVEGLATFVSGQLDADRKKAVKEAILQNNFPDGLEKFWTGSLKYGLSGSVVECIDHVYGREKIKLLLKVNTKELLYEQIGASEEEILSIWKKFVLEKY